MSNDPVGVRVQRMPQQDQVLVLASIAAARSAQNDFSATDVGDLYDDARIPKPARVSNVFTTLSRKGFCVSLSTRGRWSLTPIGRQQVSALIGHDAPALVAEGLVPGAELGHRRHTLVPASLAPPQLLAPVAEFTSANPPENNVFGMTRFPDSDEDQRGPDPVAGTLGTASDVLSGYGMNLILASDRQMVDDVWGNVSGHMWASNYGLAIFEDRRGRGMNYNLVIEVGGMLMSGRRCLLLKDKSIERMPTDFVGLIYKSVDLDDPSTVADAVHTWAKDDLGLGQQQK